MREAMVILPQFDNQHRPLKHVRAMLTKRLMRAFGGCTVRSAHGSWLDDKGHPVIEPVWEIVTACDDTPTNAAAIRASALQAGEMAEQQAMYCRYPSGDVEIIDTRPAVLKAAA